MNSLWGGPVYAHISSAQLLDKCCGVGLAGYTESCAVNIGLTDYTESCAVNIGLTGSTESCAVNLILVVTI
jgi:hypothetical protein